MERRGHGGGAGDILNPYDGMLLDRPRLKEIFAFEYVLEQFKPRPQRKYGFFAHPILMGDRFVGMLDAEVDREREVLRVNAVHEFLPFEPEEDEMVRAEIVELAEWLRVAMPDLPRMSADAPRSGLDGTPRASVPQVDGEARGCNHCDDADDDRAGHVRLTRTLRVHLVAGSGNRRSRRGRSRSGGGGCHDGGIRARGTAYRNGDGSGVSASADQRSAGERASRTGARARCPHRWHVRDGDEQPERQDEGGRREHVATVDLPR